MAFNDNASTSRPCEDCGGVVVTGLEGLATAGPKMTSTDVPEVGSEWCTNLDCPSNYAVRDLWRVGVNDHRCMVCGDRSRAPMGAVLRHRQTHSSNTI